MQPINFFDDPLEAPRDPEDVRLRQLGLYVYDDGRRIAVGFDLTPFKQRPSLEVSAKNARGELAGSLTIIEALTPNFNLTMHLRDREPTDLYEFEAIVFYKEGPEGQRTVVDQRSTTVDVSQSGEHIA
jgi:hypothetical protein